MAGIEPACRRSTLKHSTNIDCSLDLKFISNEQTRPYKSEFS